jgi:prevent-host-death family protein
MDELNASKFKEQCLALLDHPEPDGLVITKHGKPVARLIPIESGCAELIGSMKGKMGTDFDRYGVGGIFSYLRAGSCLATGYCGLPAIHATRYRQRSCG